MSLTWNLLSAGSLGVGLVIMSAIFPSKTNSFQPANLIGLGHSQGALLTITRD